MANMMTTSLLLETLLSIKRKPVAVKFLFNQDEYKLFEGKHITNMLAYCTAVARASSGKAYKLTLDNFACLGAAMALGFIKPKGASIAGTRRVKNGSYKDLCTSRSVSKDMVYCEHDVYGVGIVPLEKYEYSDNPDVVILVTTPYNAMRILQGYGYHYGQAKTIKMVGMQAICQECTSYPFETNNINVSMLCSGTRMMARWSADELGVGIPFNRFATVVDGVRKTVNPFERNEQKKIIEDKLKSKNSEDAVCIEYNKNYDDGCYIGIKGLNNSETL